jgi:hypothetical protein
MAVSTRPRAASLTSSGEASVRLTVAVETPARAATSWMVALRRAFLPCRPGWLAMSKRSVSAVLPALQQHSGLTASNLNIHSM